MSSEGSNEGQENKGVPHKKISKKAVTINANHPHLILSKIEESNTY